MANANPGPRELIKGKVLLPSVCLCFAAAPQITRRGAASELLISSRRAASLRFPVSARLNEVWSEPPPLEAETAAPPIPIPGGSPRARGHQEAPLSENLQTLAAGDRAR